MTVDVRIGDALEQLRLMPDHSVHMCVTSPPYWGLRNYGHLDQIGLEKDPQLFLDRLVQVFREIRRVIRPDGTLWVNMGDSYTDGGRGDDVGSTLTGSRRSQRESRLAVNRKNARPFGLGPKQLIMMPHRLAMALQVDGWIVRMDNVWNKPNPMPESVSDRTTKCHEYVFQCAARPKYFYDAIAVMEPITQATIERLNRPNADNHSGSTRAHAGEKSNGSMKAMVRKSGNKERKPGSERGCPEGNRANVSGSVPWASDGSHRPQYRRALEIATEAGLTEAHIDAIRACGITDVGKAALTQSGAGRNTPEQIRLAAEAKKVLGGYYREFLTVQGKRNKRSVWTISTKPFTGAHFATFPPELAELCILAGTSSRGCCPRCGAPWRRGVAETDIVDPSHRGSRFDTGKTGAKERRGNRAKKEQRTFKMVTGWIPTCDHDEDPVPCTVLDPFFGAGTTGLVAQRLNRHAIGIELNPEYAAMARDRIQKDGAHGYQQTMEIL